MAQISHLSMPWATAVGGVGPVSAGPSGHLNRRRRPPFPLFPRPSVRRGQLVHRVGAFRGGPIGPIRSEPQVPSESPRRPGLSSAE